MLDTLKRVDEVLLSGTWKGVKVLLSDTWKGGDEALLSDTWKGVDEVPLSDTWTGVDEVLLSDTLGVDEVFLVGALHIISDVL